MFFKDYKHCLVAVALVWARAAGFLLSGGRCRTGGNWFVEAQRIEQGKDYPRHLSFSLSQPLNGSGMGVKDPLNPCCLPP